MRNLDTLLTSEMDQTEWTEFRKRWMDEYAQGLHIECGTDLVGAETIAEIRFEDYVGQEGYSMRDEEIIAGRMSLYPR